MVFFLAQLQKKEENEKVKVDAHLGYDKHDKSVKTMFVIVFSSKK
jgi:hypothetical protein